MYEMGKGSVKKNPVAFPPRIKAAAPKIVTVLRWPVRPKGLFTIIFSPPRIRLYGFFCL